MSWTPLRQRLNQLPLILAGPLLRRTEPDAVTVWVALQEPCHVGLRVYKTDPDQDFAPQLPLLEGEATAIAVGQFLHVVAITARPINGDGLQPGQIYAYDLIFERHADHWHSSVAGRAESSSLLSLKQALNSAFLPAISISYFDHHLPTFALPPQDVNQLKLVHGSCRKPHGGGKDALPILDGLIAHTARRPNDRPHQLFLTGDQIYGDDVANPLLFTLIDAGETLLGWEEQLPMYTSRTSLTPGQLKPGERSQVAQTEAGFTAGLHGQADKDNSHLFSFGEYCAIYLMAWSPVLWPKQFPPGWKLQEDRKKAKAWDRAIQVLQDFLMSLGRVQRALANIPTYLIFDDHDISDDWYLNRAWCQRVLEKPLGRRTLQNGLSAYAIFQAWGNTPEQFQAGQPGAKLLDAVQRWSASGGTDEAVDREIGQYLGLPDSDPATGRPHFRQDGSVWILDHSPLTLKWHYTVRSHCHEVLVLDTRTWRGYPMEGDAIAPPTLLSPTAFDQQIREPLAETDRLRQAGSPVKATLIVAPTNLITSDLIDVVQLWDLRQGKPFGNDVGDAWNINKAAFAVLLKTVFEQRDRVIVLSGDIHYGYVARLNYWSRPKTAHQFERSQVLVQLTASAFKNEEWKTQLIHSKIKSIALEQPDAWMGWHEPPDLRDIQITPGRVQVVKLPPPAHGPVVRRIPKFEGNSDLFWRLVAADARSLPDWQYRAGWMKRQPTQPVPWGKTLAKGVRRARTHGGPWAKAMRRSIGKLWYNQWVQEGEEVVGYNNLGLVWFNWPEQPQASPTVVQDLYWYASWADEAVVFSRFSASLQVDPPPEMLPTLAPSLNVPLPTRQTGVEESPVS